LRLVLCGIGSRGDVQPLLALGQALRQRGHQVVVAAPPNFAHWVQSLGFAFAPVGVDMQQFLAEHPAVLTGKALQAGPIQQHYFATELPRQVQELRALCEGTNAQALVWAGLAFGAPSVAEQLGIPALGVLYTSCVIPSPLHPPPTVRWHGLWPWANRLLWRLHRQAAGHLVGQPLNQARLHIGLQAVDLHQHLMHCDYALAVDAGLFPADPAWPDTVHRTPFLFLDDTAALDPELEAWLQDGEPPVYVGFGSMAGPATARLQALLREALLPSARRCLIGTGWAGNGATGGPSGARSNALPAHWRRVASTPHARLFERVALVVHHGGSGTMASALRAGVPQVIVPLILDQYHHAERLHRARLIPRPVPMESITAPQLAHAVQTALAMPAAARLAVAQRLGQSQGANHLSLYLERLLAARRHRPS
jgi:UDP:flavonoid glycosyltransferase YjiC (YdhE family)